MHCTRRPFVSYAVHRVSFLRSRPHFGLGHQPTPSCKRLAVPRPPCIRSRHSQTMSAWPGEESGQKVVGKGRGNASNGAVPRIMMAAFPWTISYRNNGRSELETRGGCSLSSAATKCSEALTSVEPKAAIPSCGRLSLASEASL